MDSLNITYLTIGVSLSLVVSFFLFIFYKNKKDKKFPGQVQEKSKMSEQKKKVVELVEEKKIQRKIQIKTVEQLQQQYPNMYYNSFQVKPKKSIHKLTALALSGSKLLFADTKNQLVLIDLKTLKKDVKEQNPSHGTSRINQLRFFVNLDNNTATAVAIGERYYYAALNFDKTIVYYQFKGGVNGIYFQQIFKFPRNSLKSDAGSIWVPQHEKYIITTGTQADTVVDIWSMKGQKIGHIDTYQIMQYQASYGFKEILIRGWTSEAKIFTIIEEKDNSFKKIQKKMPIALDESPQYCCLDNLSMYVVSISKKNHLKLWPIYSSFLLQSHTERFKQNRDLEVIIPGLNKCAVFSQEILDGHFKTIIVVANDNKFALVDSELRVIRQIEGVECEQIYITGKKKNAILGVVGKTGKIIFWNITEEIKRTPQIKL